MAVRALLPENAAEGRMAAQIVAAEAWSMDCMRLAEARRREPTIADKCRAQAMGMMREAKSATRTLLRMQAARRAIEADPAAAERAEWIEHGVGRMMQAGLAPEAGEDEAERHIADPEYQEAVLDVGAVSHPGINPQDASRETEAGLADPIPDAAAKEGSKARGAAPWTQAKGEPLETFHCLGGQGGPIETEPSPSRPFLHSQTGSGF